MFLVCLYLFTSLAAAAAAGGCYAVSGSYIVLNFLLLLCCLSVCSLLTPFRSLCPLRLPAPPAPAQHHHLLNHTQEPHYLVKWSGRAHIHNEWLPESQLLNMARRKLINFKKRHGDAPVNFTEEEWLQPERFVARRPSPSNPGWEVLVKWQGQVCGGAGLRAVCLVNATHVCLCVCVGWTAVAACGCVACFQM